MLISSIVSMNDMYSTKYIICFLVGGYIANLHETFKSMCDHCWIRIRISPSLPEDKEMELATGLLQASGFVGDLTQLRLRHVLAWFVLSYGLVFWN